VIGLGKGRQQAHRHQTPAAAESPHHDRQRFIAGENQDITLILAQH
jgi:hypothetical protein